MLLITPVRQIARVSLPSNLELKRARYLFEFNGRCAYSMRDHIHSGHIGTGLLSEESKKSERPL